MAIAKCGRKRSSTLHYLLLSGRGGRRAKPAVANGAGVD